MVRREHAGIDGASPGYVTAIPVDGLFGVYDLLSGPFVAVIRRSKLRYSIVRRRDDFGDDVMVWDSYVVMVVV